MKIYMKCTRDKYELPVAVADTPGELALMVGKSKGSVLSLISKKSRGWYKIEVDEGMTMTDNEIVKSYKEAKNKQNQIKVLAELNDTNPEEIKKILKSKGVDLRGGNFRAKNPEPTPEIVAADPVPGEIGFNESSVVPRPPLGLTPRKIAEDLFNEAQIWDIIEAMHRYKEANMAYPAEWREELKERL